MCNQLKNQEQISVLHGPFHRSFTLFPSLLSTSVLVVSTITLLPLFPWHSTFHPFWFFPFLFNTFLSTSFLSLLILSCFSSFFLLTFLPDSQGLSQSLLKSIHYIQRVQDQGLISACFSASSTISFPMQHSLWCFPPKRWVIAICREGERFIEKILRTQ